MPESDRDSPSPVQLFVTLQTVARQDPLSIEFSRQEYGVGCIPFSRGSSWLRDQTWVSHIAGRFFIVWATREALRVITHSFHASSAWYSLHTVVFSTLELFLLCHPSQEHGTHGGVSTPNAWRWTLQNILWCCLHFSLLLLFWLSYHLLPGFHANFWFCFQYVGIVHLAFTQPTGKSL